MTSTHRLRRCAATLTAALTLALCGCSSSNPSAGPTTTGGAQTPSASGYDGALLPANLPSHPFTLTNQGGRRVSLSDYRGKVTILTFLYTSSTTTAPLIAQQIRGALDELESESRPPTPAVAISVDPSADTPAHVRAFLRVASLTGRMEYLSGTLAQLRPVWRAYAAVPASAGPLAYERNAFVLLLNRAGMPRVEFPVGDLTPEALAHDVRKLTAERE
jgi:protein SCO1